MMENAGGLWGLATMLGPILLGAAILWGLLRNRSHRRPEDIRDSEAGARQVYQESEKADNPDPADDEREFAKGPARDGGHADPADPGDSRPS